MSAQVEKRASLSCSVIIPCYNEEGNIEKCIQRVPSLGRFTEIVVVDDGSTDNTRGVVEELMKKRKALKFISYKPNRGKGYAVKRGMDIAKGDVLIILDADMAVEPEELPRFFQPIEEGKAEAVTGTRLLLPMEPGAMSRFRRLGNRVFSLIFTWLMEMKITDTLCGTKALRKVDYEKIQMGRCPWGDFDILLGIAKLKLRLVEVPVRYKRRKAGQSKMKTFRHGLVLLRMCFLGFKELKWRKWWGRKKEG